MSEQQVQNALARPFVCCAEPVADLSHNVHEVLAADVVPKSDDIFMWDQYNLAQNADPTALLFAVYSEANVFAPLEAMAQTDPSTYRHAIRVGGCAAKTALTLGLDICEAEVAVRAALLHDHGKLHPDVQAAIHSTATVQRNPSLYNTIQTHPWHGVRLLASYRHSRNVLQVVGNHHSLQTERPAYGVFSSVVSMPESNGYRPNTGRLLEIVAASDLFDALWNAPQTKERRYQQFTKEAYDRLDFLKVALGSLNISDPVRQTVYAQAMDEERILG